jgi:PadR family transcriptional regulator, regulatory protein PadR
MRRMAGRVSYLGEFEQIVMLAVARLEADAYGTRIRREIEDCTGRAVTIGAAYATLDRLVEKGYLRAREGDPVPERGGRARRFFRLTPSGIAALEAARDLQMRMWAGLQLRKAGRKA